MRRPRPPWAPPPGSGSWRTTSEARSCSRSSGSFRARWARARTDAHPAGQRPAARRRSRRGARPVMPPPPAPRLSVVMSTRNRGQALPRSLAALAASRTTLPWELVVVDNGSTDDTGRVLDEFRAGARFELRIIEQRRAGLSRARNAGLEAARGEIVCFTDDDCYVQPDFLDAMSGVFDEQELGYVGGRVVLFDPADAPITIQPSESRRDLPPRSYIAVGTIHGANFAFRRTVLERVGGFDVRLGAGTSIPSGEDVDMLSRASAAGFAGAYDPRPTVLHHHRPPRAGEPERLRRRHPLR